MILELLDYRSALALSRTNHFFWDRQPADFVADDDKLDHVLVAESFRRNLQRDCLACFVCMTVLRPRHFERRYRVKDLRRLGEDELARRCKRCGREARAGSV